MKKILLLLLLLTSFIFTKDFGYDMITIDTVPSGAALYLNDKPIGNSPANVRVQNGLFAPKYNVRSELNGYKNKFTPLEQHWIPGVAITGGCCGFLFFPAYALLVYAKKHDSNYIIYLQKD